MPQHVASILRVAPCKLCSKAVVLVPHRGACSGAMPSHSQRPAARDDDPYVDPPVVTSQTRDLPAALLTIRVLKKDASCPLRISFGLPPTLWAETEGTH